METINYRSCRNLETMKQIVTRGSILLVDHGISQSAERYLANLDTKHDDPLIILRTSALSQDLMMLLDQHETVDPLYVFPGHGSQKVHHDWRHFKLAPAVHVHSKRYWKPGEDPVVESGEILPEQLLLLNFQTVVVIDNVISSGQTLGRLWERNAWKLPRASWIGCSWLSQVPHQKTVISQKYDRLLIGAVVENPKGLKVPINSLSTLIDCPEMATNYAKRNLAQPDLFLEILADIRQDSVRQPELRA